MNYKEAVILKSDGNKLSVNKFYHDIVCSTKQIAWDVGFPTNLHSKLLYHNYIWLLDAEDILINTCYLMTRMYHFLASLGITRIINHHAYFPNKNKLPLSGLMFLSDTWIFQTIIMIFPLCKQWNHFYQ